MTPPNAPDPLALAYARMARAEMQQLRECLLALDRGENIGVYHAALAPYVAEVGNERQA